MKIILVVCLFVGFVAAQDHPGGPHQPPPDGPHQPPPDGPHQPPPDGPHPPHPGGPHPSNTTCSVRADCNIPDPGCQNHCIDGLCHCHLPPARRACPNGQDCVCPNGHPSHCFHGHCQCHHNPGVGK